MQKNLLTSIQGLGPKISEKLINHFMTEENVIEAISEARISEIASIKGIGRKLALKIIQEFHSTKDGIYTNQVLMTEDIIRIHNKIIEIIQEYAQTQYVKDRFSLLFPLPSDKIDVIKSRLQYYKQNIDELNKIGDEILSKIRIMLKKVRPIVPVNLIGKLNLNRIVITDDKETYRYLIENRVDRYCKIMLIKQSDIEDSELFKAFDIVILITNSKSKLEFLDNIENSIILDDDWDINDIVPEFIIGNFVGNNYEIIITSYKLIKIFAHFSKKYSVFN
ncbi:MAG: helix-hairpin-helix domain-containing protein, partial [Candidatus Helarchaeota archaeon]